MWRQIKLRLFQHGRIRILISGFLLVSLMLFFLRQIIGFGQRGQRHSQLSTSTLAYDPPKPLIRIPSYSGDYLRYIGCLRNAITTNTIKPPTVKPAAVMQPEQGGQSSTQKTVENLSNKTTTRKTIVELDLFNRMPTLIEQCQTTFILDRLKFVIGGNTQEEGDGKKYFFLLPRPDYSPRLDGDDKNSCRELTIGIGNNIEAELKFRDVHQPQCQFYGVEPVNEMGTVFRDILGGTVFQLAVGWTTWNQTATMNFLTRNEKDTAGVHTVLLQMIPYPLHRFLREKLEPIFIKGDDHRKPQPLIIDHLWLDNEGPEWAMSDQYFTLLLQGNELQDPVAPWTICQINVQFYGPLNGRYGVVGGGKFDRLYQTLIHQGVYLPLVGARYKEHHRAFLFNFGSEYCVNKYLWPTHPFFGP